MNDEVMSPHAFYWFITLLTGIVAGSWAIYDTINLIRTRNYDRKDPVVRDKHFGYVMGIVIGVTGVWGCLRFHGVV
jgi:hypothetical protein